MNDIKLSLNKEGRGAFFIEQDNERLAEMEIAVKDDNLIVYHTEVNERLKNQGIGGKLLDNMAAYARAHKLKVVPLCPFVNVQFRRHPEKFSDIWNTTWK
jgi:predicted GNAT family acetyltransferase